MYMNFPSTDRLAAAVSTPTTFDTMSLFTVVEGSKERIPRFDA